MSNISLLRLRKELQSFTSDPCEDFTASPVKVNKAFSLTLIYITHSK